MKNKDIMVLVSNGVMTITTHSVSSDHAFQIFLFRKALKKALTDLMMAEQALVKEAGIEDGPAFDAKLAKLRQDGPTAELEAAEDKLKRYVAMHEALDNEDVRLDGIKAIPYEQWRLLQQENKAVTIGGRTVDALSGEVEIILENILWKAPSE